MNLKYFNYTICLLLFLCSFLTKAQDNPYIDNIIAIVGEEVVLKSDVEKQFIELKNQSQNKFEENMKCLVLRGILQQKLLLNQAKIDSVEITEDEVEGELERRFRHYVQMLGSQENFEKYYNKSIVELKDEFRIAIKEQLLSNKVRSSITQEINVSPSEVKVFFGSIPSDSIPYFNTKVEVCQIVIHPKTSPLIEAYTLEKAQKLKERILNGEDFASLAGAYSEDPGSAMKGGELDFMHRTELVPEFAEAAFKLKKDSVSDIIKTSFGYHIIQGIERRGEKIKVRHILLRTPLSSRDELLAQNKLDSIRSLILTEKLSFEKAVEKFSEDENTNGSGGLIYNNQSGSTLFETSDLSPELYFTVEKMQLGDISSPVAYNTLDNKKAFRIIKLKKEINAHRASLDTDYEEIKNTALATKKEEKVQDWVKQKLKQSYIYIDNTFSDCEEVDVWYQNKSAEK